MGKPDLLAVSVSSGDGSETESEVESEPKSKVQSEAESEAAVAQRPRGVASTDAVNTVARPMAQVHATTPEWVEATVMALVQLVRHWHNVIVADFCGQIADRTAEIRLLLESRDNLKRLVSRASTLSGDSEDSRESESESEYRSEISRTVNEIRPAIADTAASGQPSHTLVQLSDTLRDTLEDYAIMAESNAQSHVSMGINTAVTVFEFAKWSVETTASSATAAKEAADEAKAHGRGLLHASETHCRSNCMRLKERWAQVFHQSRALIAGMRAGAASKEMTVLLDKMTAQSRSLEVTLMGDDDGRGCHSGAVFFMRQLVRLEKLLKLYVEEGQGSSDELVAAMHRQSAVSKELQALNQDIEQLEIALGQGGSGSEEDRLINVRRRFEKEQQLDEALSRRADTQRKLSVQQSDVHRLEAHVKDQELAEANIKALPALLEEVAAVKALAVDFVDECGRLSSAFTDIDVAVDEHRGKFVCRLATTVRAQFNLAIDKALEGFCEDTGTLAQQVAKNLREFQGKAWNQLTVGKNMVASGSASMGLLGALIAEQRYHADQMSQVQRRYHEGASGLNKLSQTGIKLADAFAPTHREARGPAREAPP